MRHWSAARQLRFHAVMILSFAFVLASTSIAQTAPSGKSAPAPGMETIYKYPGLVPELGRLSERWQHDVKFPPDRNRSDLLPLLPPSTIAYFAFPNYGEAAHQTLTIFRQELQASPDLRAWWSSPDMTTVGPKIEDALDRFSQVSEYLGDEIVVSAALQGRDPNALVIAQVRKPGLKAVLQNAVVALGDKSKPGVRIVDPEELAKTTGIHAEETLVLVRPDFVLASSNLDALRSFNFRLDRGAHDFASSPFAQRILQSYVGGASWIGAVDLQTLIATMPKDPSFATFQRSGFADVKYAVWKHKGLTSHSISQAELSFTGPRHGIAAWLAAPAPLGSLDFVSPKAILATSIVLNNPPQLLEDLKQLSASGPNPMSPMMQMEQAFGVNVKDDLLAQLGGELTFELDSSTPHPVWKAMLSVKDASRMQQTISMMLAHAHVSAEDYDEDGVTYHLVRVPSGATTTVIAYTFVDRYLVIASSTETLVETLRLHQTGESLGKSRRFLDSLPAGHSGFSALLYEDPSALIAMQFQHLSPELAQSMAKLIGKNAPVVACVYGEPSAIVEASTNSAVDAGVILAGAAVAIPNLLRSRVPPNEASAVARIRTMNTAQITYATMHPDRGFAPDLATMATESVSKTTSSSAHAGLLDSTVGNPTCTGANWCISAGYRFMVKATCGFGKCRDYVAIATPQTSTSGTRSFCSTSDRVIRYSIVPPLTAPLRPNDCKSWLPLR